MLVIRCREGETVSIGDDIEVTVLGAGAGRVKLGFNAPSEVLVLRRCVELTRQQNRAALEVVGGSVPDSLRPYLTGAQSHHVSGLVSLSRAGQRRVQLGAATGAEKNFSNNQDGR
jgi:carbon storage regulator